MRVHKLTLHEAVRRLGLPGLGGAVLLAAAAGWAMAVVVPGIESRERAEQHVLRAQAQAAAVLNGEVHIAQPPARQLDAFYAGLPAQPAATSAIDGLYAAAEAEQISLARGEYALAVEQGTDMARYQILLPVRGSYAQLRRFIDAAIAKVPGLSVEDLDLQRKVVSDTELEGRIRMTLYLSRR
ncbi:GspMb/PilO family protein [Aromatoleum evansii]|uniref:GspMb/PilO family protein n=1 Tax=Aromatoleum evansii TaxID=59406 RepID=UPI00145CAE74|nr:GspMb/PilO family protein [Aromatoleum evansii]NMG32549.1 pilus assembly protein PilO [Aromatoleum evansii]